MVDFMGVNFLDDRIVTTVVDRKARVIQESSAPVPGIQPGPGEGVFEVRQEEWVRAGSLALQDAYFRLPIKLRKLWGFALAGPAGWIAIDPDLDAISPLRLTPGRSPIPDFQKWLAENPKQRNHIFQLLSPKDYFRLRVSGGLAADVTQASRTGLLLEGQRYWSVEALEEAGIREDWLPPVFDSAVATGRISEAGVQMTGIPGGIWVVAGADSSASRQLSAADFRRGELLVEIHRREIELQVGLEDPREGPWPGAALDGWERAQSALPGWSTLLRRFRPPDGVAPERSFFRETLDRALGELEGAGLGPSGIVLDGAEPLPEWALEFGDESMPPVRPGFFAGEPDPGPALLAGLARPIFRDPDILYRRLGESRARAREESAEGSTDS